MDERPNGARLGDVVDNTTLMLLLIPVVLVELVMKVIALVSLKKAPATRGPKAAWAIGIVLTSGVGWIAYFLVGRLDASPAQTKP